MPHYQNPDRSRYQVEKTRYQDSQRLRYQYSEKVWLNDYQYGLFQAAMRGLTPEQINTEPVEERRKICAFHAKAQRVLNLWKQQLVNQLFEQLCYIQLKNFPKNPFDIVLNDTCIGVKNFGKKTDETFTCDITFAELRVNRLEIIKKLISVDLLPENFFELKKPT